MQAFIAFKTVSAEAVPDGVVTSALVFHNAVYEFESSLSRFSCGGLCVLNKLTLLYLNVYYHHNEKQKLNINF